ncbi:MULTISPECIES: YkvA family protein [Shewanella]|uniref:YkvA family protein n=1 Tax=Shewanella TaxID=22 RepID=UPI001678E9CD|nr:YkvA family protein [Shewanella fodinae]MBO1270989.1 DUF1232 domain-containing protein [Shewanella sp. 4t3-1-2LB]MCL2908332.1 DUF1232 domain-containing protein [Shewanella fodinae]
MMQQEYSEQGFWDKLKGFALKAGREVVENALLLYYAAKRENTPKWAKTAIFGALAYFISPLDAIPDLTPIVGFSDDLGALAAALAMVSMYIDDSVHAEATSTLKRWFGD